MITRLHSPRRFIALFVVLALAGFLTAIPWDRSAAAATNATVGVGAPGGLAVFTPNVVNISVGDTVTFSWVDGVHDARNAQTTDVYLPLSTSTASQTTTFTTPGTYYFYCSVHAKAADATDANIAAGTKQVGKVVVAAASTPTSTATATTTATTTTTATATATTTATAPATPVTTPVVPPPLTVLMPADYFNPVAMTVKSGDTVTFKNTDTDLHTVVSVPGNSPAPMNLSIKPGDSAKFTFRTPGLYWYYCNAHATWDADNAQVKANDTVDNPSEPMEGFILVLAPAAAPASATVTIPGDTTNNDSYRSFVTTVQTGAVVSFDNKDADLHNVISVPGSNSPEKLNILVPSGQSTTYTFKTPGLYWYYCDIHADFDAKTGQVSAHKDADQPHEPMMGVIAVLAAPPAPTPTVAPPTPVPTAPPPTAAPATPAATAVAPLPPSTGSGAGLDSSGRTPWLLGGVGLLLAGLLVTAVARRNT